MIIESAVIFVLTGIGIATPALGTYGYLVVLCSCSNGQRQSPATAQLLLLKLKHRRVYCSDPFSPLGDFKTTQKMRK
jgi:hypothetical protein